MQFDQLAAEFLFSEQLDSMGKKAHIVNRKIAGIFSGSSVGRQSFAAGTAGGGAACL
jgi:hypothetical protein